VAVGIGHGGNQPTGPDIPFPGRFFGTQMRYAALFIQSNAGVGQPVSVNPQGRGVKRAW